MHRKMAIFWFVNKCEEASLQDEPRSGRPSAVDDEELLEYVKQDSYADTPGLSTVVGVSN